MNDSWRIVSLLDTSGYLSAPASLGAYLLMNVQLPEDLCRVEQMVLLEDPVICQYNASLLDQSNSTYFLPFHAKRGKLRMSATQYPLMRNKNVRKA
jgi:hypothetical protein